MAGYFCLERATVLRLERELDANLVRLQYAPPYTALSVLVLHGTAYEP
jgi:hypothetical protein